ncbi:MAG: formyltransferase family protein [Gaiellaceae bacterium]
MTSVALLANDAPGLRVAEYLASRGDRIERLYLHAEEQRKLGDEIVAASGCPPERVFEAVALKDPAHVTGLREANIEWIVLVYWTHLISADVIACVRRGTVNFHPALLPVNRGWYPHVHSILDGTPTGVTLHAVDPSADTGPVWAQRPVPLSPYDTAFTIYNRLQDEIVDLFREAWPKIVAGELVPTAQDESEAVYHRKSEIVELDELDLDAVMPVRDVINRLRARSFGSRGFAWYKENGERVYVNVRLGKNPAMDKVKPDDRGRHPGPRGDAGGPGHPRR